MSNFDEYVNTVSKWLEEAPVDLRQEFLSTPFEELTKFHHGLGTTIRNEFKLWEVPWTAQLKDGVDYSADHPDAISMRIIAEVWKRFNCTNQPTGDSNESNHREV